MKYRHDVAKSKRSRQWTRRRRQRGKARGAAKASRSRERERATHDFCRQCTKGMHWKEESKSSQAQVCRIWRDRIDAVQIDSIFRAYTSKSCIHQQKTAQRPTCTERLHCFQIKRSSRQGAYCQRTCIYGPTFASRQCSWTKGTVHVCMCV